MLENSVSNLFCVSLFLLYRISSLDPVWEAGYERQFFDFTAGDGEIFSATDDDTIVSQGPDN